MGEVLRTQRIIRDMGTSKSVATVLRHPPSDFVAGEWKALAASDSGAPGAITSRNPARPGEVVWSGLPDAAHVNEAIAAARAALPGWSMLSREKRFGVLRRFQQVCKAREADMATMIREEIGKAAWEAKGEASLLSSKVDITLDESDVGGMHRVRDFEFPITPPTAAQGSTMQTGGRVGRCSWRPHGVMAVLGPFNFPAHLPNGHIVPALAMGNTIVFKPSDKAPGVGQLLVEFFDEALAGESDLAHTPGIINLVQGGADIASAIVKHPGIDGILFTGSWPVGRKILEANLDQPGRIVALELGGNNAAVVMPDADLRQAAIEIVRSAFNTTGQRCTCTRRVIVHEDIASRFIPAMCKAASNLIIGDPRATHPVFMGPIINAAARDAVLRAQADFARAGGVILVESTAPVTPEGGFYITPGIMQVEWFVPYETAAGWPAPPYGPRRSSSGSKSFDECSDNRDEAGADVEVFGPLLRVCIVDSLDAAIEQANATRYGLAASIFTNNQAAADRFLAESRAGCVNVNTGTAGASSKLPFGGLGLSGNHRPAGSFSLDYCAYPVAGMIEHGHAATIPEGMRFEDSWLR